MSLLPYLASAPHRVSLPLGTGTACVVTIVLGPCVVNVTPETPRPRKRAREVQSHRFIARQNRKASYALTWGRIMAGRPDAVKDDVDIFTISDLIRNPEAGSFG